MNALVGLDPVEQVLAQYETARRQGAPKPGRGKLADATGLSAHHVRQAVEKINAASTAGASETGRQPSHIGLPPSGWRSPSHQSGGTASGDGGWLTNGTGRQGIRSGARPRADAAT
ncbi:hypothetical protein Amsp01_105280 [Amycolatopsis sp. NBRC 101858]|nr:hypothetical protein Amsp01_105280 [Amycolatopsis sp. NBRC 101858]